MTIEQNTVPRLPSPAEEEFQARRLKTLVADIGDNFADMDLDDARQIISLLRDHFERVATDSGHFTR